MTVFLYIWELRFFHLAIYFIFLHFLAQSVFVFLVRIFACFIATCFNIDVFYNRFLPKCDKSIENPKVF